LKKLLVITLSLLFSFLFCVSPVLADLSYEQGLSDWTIEQRTDAWPDTLHEFTTEVVTDRYSDGIQSVRLGAKIVGNYSAWEDVDTTQTIVWKGPYDLTRGLSVSVDMADIQRSEPQSYWGWGMESDLILSDGTNEARSMLWNYHEENTGTYGPPGLEDNLYNEIVTGADGTEWFRYNVPLTNDLWGINHFGGGLLTSLDLSNVMIGVAYGSINWNSSPQTLWANGLVDNIQMEYDPLPISINANPNTLNLKSGGKENSVTVFTNFPYSLINSESLTLNNVSATRTFADDNGNLVAKFDRQTIIATGIAPPQATMILRGLDTSGVPIIGSDTIKVINPGK
jgi:hypothetical protein